MAAVKAQWLVEGKYGLARYGRARCALHGSCAAMRAKTSSGVPVPSISTTCTAGTVHAEFKAGRMDWDGKMVTPDKRKGKIVPRSSSSNRFSTDFR